MYFSNDRERTGVIEIVLKSLCCIGLLTLLTLLTNFHQIRQVRLT